MYGYELKSRFDKATGGFWQLNFGQIYSTLDRLEREGLVERIGIVEENSDRKIFRITVRGRSRLDDWLLKPVAHTRALRDDLFVRLLFVDRSDPEPVLRMIDRHRDVYELQMRKLTRRKTQLEKLKLDDQAAVTNLLMDAALFHAEAELRWLSHVQQKLTHLWSRKPHRRLRS
jgi:DNA-binding PadR family transcriptional regulator